MRRVLGGAIVVLLLVAAAAVQLTAADPQPLAKSPMTDGAKPLAGPPGAEQAESYEGATPLAPKDSFSRMTLAPGFKATLFAAEPDVLQPIALQIDDRGRLWVAECFSYPNWAEKGNDRLLIFEDTDNDGAFDKRTVFWDKGNYLTGFALGFGGVYVCCAPNVSFIPDEDGDDKPDGPPLPLLEGFSTKGVHNVVNGLTWGPDGWLWGMNGITAPSRVGKAGSADDEKVPLSCGVWRYHPTRHVFEVVCHGTTNPWGLDFNDKGEAFFTNCVIPHLFHVVPGGHYRRMFGNDYNPYAYGLMEACCDHLHWGGGEWTSSRGGKGKHSEAGGGHAHSGAMIYLGDAWPEAYRGGVFMCNIHGNRLNHDRFERHGSGYVARHAPDFLFANDAWFRAIDLQYGPDGNVFVIDWNDSEECHDRNPTHRETGRIYKISYGEPKEYEKRPLDKLQTPQLALMVQHKNEHFVRHSRRILQERAARGEEMGVPRQVFMALLLDEQAGAAMRLRGLFGLNAVRAADSELLFRLLDDEDEYLRAWAIRLLVDLGNPPDLARERFVELAETDKSSLVRLYLASALQKINVSDRWPLAEKLAAHDEDADDPNIPLMIWYGIEPAVGADKAKAAGFLAKVKIPKVRQFVARRIAEAK